MYAKLQGIEVETTFVSDDDFAVENTFRGELFTKRVEHLGEVAVQGFFVATLDDDFIAITKHQDAEAIPLGLVDPVAT